MHSSRSKKRNRESKQWQPQRSSNSQSVSSPMGDNNHWHSDRTSSSQKNSAKGNTAGPTIHPSIRRSGSSYDDYNAVSDSRYSPGYVRGLSDGSRHLKGDNGADRFDVGDPDPPPEFGESGRRCTTFGYSCFLNYLREWICNSCGGKQ